MTRQEQIVEQQLKNKAIVESFKNSDAYQLLIVPLQEKLKGLDSAYGLKAERAHYFDGLYEGLAFVLLEIEKAERNGVQASELAQRIALKKAQESEEIDSTDL